jgi:hypothetical protein
LWLNDGNLTPVQELGSLIHRNMNFFVILDYKITNCRIKNLNYCILYQDLIIHLYKIKLIIVTSWIL